MKHDSNSLGERIKLIRNDASQKDFGVKFGATPNTIRRYESGVNPPDAKFISALCEEYNISPTWLVLGEGPMYRGENAGAEPEPEQAPEKDINIQQLLNMTAEVLISETVYRPALAANIKAFHRAIGIELDNKEMRGKIDRLEERMAAMERRLDTRKAAGNE